MKIVTMGLNSRIKNLNIKRRAGIVMPTLASKVFLMRKKKYMTTLQLQCAQASAVQYMETHIIATLRKKFHKQIKSVSDKIRKENIYLKHNKSKNIWLCWMQGIENAPEIVRLCYQSVKDYFDSDYEINIITSDNYKDYVEFPRHILEKYDKGIISHTHFSDLLRLELLIRYGGIWIDSTVLLTGKRLPQYMTDDDLFVFQSIWPQLFGRATRFESWYISACQNNMMLMFVRDMLYLYWLKFDIMVDYWLIYDFFEFAIEQFPDLWQKVIPFSQCDIHILQDRLLDVFNKEVFDITMQRTYMQKLNWRYSKEETSREGTVYKYLINNFKIFSGDVNNNEKND